MTSYHRVHYVDAGMMRIKKNMFSSGFNYQRYGTCLVASVLACAWHSYPILDARFTDFGFSEKLLNVRNSFWIALLLHWPQLKYKQGMQKGCW